MRQTAPWCERMPEAAPIPRWGAAFLTIAVEVSETRRSDAPNSGQNNPLSIELPPLPRIEAGATLAGHMKMPGSHENSETKGVADETIRSKHASTAPSSCIV